MRNEKTINPEGAAPYSLKAIFFGTLFGVAFCALLLLLCTFLFTRVKNVPEHVILPLTLGISALGAFASGYVSVRISRAKGLLYGALSGFALFLVLLLAAFVFAREPLSIITLIRAVLLILSGAVGGVVGVNQRER